MHALGQMARDRLRVGALPLTPPVVVSVERTAGLACSLCGAPEPQIARTYAGGQIVRLHAACAAVIDLEQQRLLEEPPTSTA